MQRLYLSKDNRLDCGSVRILMLGMKGLLSGGELSETKWPNCNPQLAYLSQGGNIAIRPPRLAAGAMLDLVHVTTERALSACGGTRANRFTSIGFLGRGQNLTI